MSVATIYDAIIEVNYEYYITENEIEMSYEDFRCEVDVKYRREHNQFPIWDEDMEERLEEIADGVGTDFLNAAIEAAEEMEHDFQYKKYKERFLSQVEVFLRCKSLAFDQKYPQTRRFKRKDIWGIQAADYEADNIFTEDAYIVLFEKLLTEGYFTLVESGGDPKHDIFHVTEV
jgi:hypothetical protein